MYDYIYLAYWFLNVKILIINIRMSNKTELKKKIGNRIQYLRLQRGLSQEKLAEMIDIATTSLSYIETGRGFTTLETLAKMAKALDVEICEIFQFTSSLTNEQMYQYILSKLDIIKNDDEKLKTIYHLLKNLF